MPRGTALSAAGYRLIARTLGRTLAHIFTEQGTHHEPMAFRAVVSSLISAFEDDNPHFDARRFRKLLDSACLGVENPDNERQLHALSRKYPNATDMELIGMLDMRVEPDNSKES